MGSLLADIKCAIRSLRHRPGFATICILTLALATGANIAVFSILYGVVLKPLPYADPDRLYVVWEDATHYGFPFNSPAPANYFDWKNQSRSFSGMGAYSPDRFVLTGSGEPIQVRGAGVSVGLLPLMGLVRPAYGRMFTEADGQPGAERAVLLSYPFWNLRFSGNPAIVGNTIQLDGETSVIAGVLPQGFVFPDGELDLLLPFTWSEETKNNRADHYLVVLGRLRDGVDEDSALQELKVIMNRLEAEYPETNKNLGVRLESLRHYVSGNVSPVLYSLFAAVGLVLLIACSNLAGLQFTQAARRYKEITIRFALGATVVRLARMMVCENLVLALAGSASGLLVSSWMIRSISAILPEEVQGIAYPGLDAYVLLFAFALAFVSGVLSGIAPAWQLARQSLSEGMKEGSPRVAGGHNPLRSAFVIGEIALCVCLVIAAGLMIRSMNRLLSVPLGFDSSHALTLRTTLSARPYSDYGTRERFYEQVLQKIRALDGVKAAGYTSHLPLTWSGDNGTFVAEGFPEPPPGQENMVSVRVISPDYFRALGAPMIEGREFDGSERLDTPRVVIVNETLARRFWPRGHAVNKRIQRGKPITPNGWLTIVGVVPDFHQSSLEDRPNPELYLPSTQRTPFYFAPQELVVRTQGEPRIYADRIRSIVRGVDPDQPISQVLSLESVVQRSSHERQARSVLFAAFGMIALLLAGLGIYGLMSHTVTRRTAEIGIRMVLGARTPQLVAMVVRPAMYLTLAGLAIGIAASWVLSRVLQSQLFEVSPTDLVTFSVVPLLIAATAWFACWLPARRTTRIDPMVALRTE